MSATTTSRITIEPGKLGGKPCVRGLRITVWDILGWLGAGMTEGEDNSRGTSRSQEGGLRGGVSVCREGWAPRSLRVSLLLDENCVPSTTRLSVSGLGPRTRCGPETGSRRRDLASGERIRLHGCLGGRRFRGVQSEVEMAAQGYPPRTVRFSFRRHRRTPPAECHSDR